MTQAAPAWFRRAMDTPYAEHVIDVDGVPVHYLEWGDRSAKALVLVHGGAAHAHWWTFLAPLFSNDWHVLALDLSGHGDSGRRERYSHEAWAREIVAVTRDSGCTDPPVVIGHSLGGLVTIQTAATHGDDLAGAIIVDSPVRRPDPESEEGARGRAFRNPGVYPDLETAMRRFRLVPDQPCEHRFIIDHIAEHSLRPTEAGWTWKFDPHLFTHAMVPMNEQLASVRCRVALLRGDRSVVVPPDVADYMYDLMGKASPVVSIPEAHHHLILDQPLAFVAAVRALLADWDHSIPHRHRG